MRVLLVRPPIHSRTLRFPGGPRFGLPTSLLYLAAALEQAHIDVKIYDALVDFKLSDLAPDRRGDYLIGPLWDAFADRALQYEPNVVGITNPFSDFAIHATRAARELKHRSPHIITVVGGPHATSAPQSFLGEGTPFDFVVRGEGEGTIVKLARALADSRPAQGLPGISFRSGSTVRSNPPAPFIDDIDQLPLPAYHLVNMERYFDLVKAGFPSRYAFEYGGSEREVSIITSRGCPYHCTFCGNHLHMGRRWRFHSAAYVLEHMRRLIEYYGVQHFHVEDDNIALHPARLAEILDGIKMKGWRLTWDTPNGIRADGLTPLLLEKIRASGCTYLVIGIESGGQRVLDDIIKKRLDLKKVSATIRLTKKMKIDMHAFYMIGFPGETIVDIKRTFAFARDALWHDDVIPHVALVRPLPDTELYRVCETAGYLTEPVRPAVDRAWRGEIYGRTMIATDSFTPADLEKLLARFDLQTIVIIALKTAAWLSVHPAILLHVLLRFVRIAHHGVLPGFRRLFFGGLLFKFNYLKARFRQPSIRH